jgi:diamine N-acetyltransferase
MDHPHPLGLAPIDRHNWQESLAVKVAPEQLPLVAGYEPVALLILAKAYIRPGDLEWEPLALISDGSVVGVVALAHSPTHTEVRHLAIDVSSQGRGLGSMAVELLLGHVSETRPTCQAVQLTVHPANERAQRLYRRHGFVPNGQMRDGEPIWVLDLKPGGPRSGTE